MKSSAKSSVSKAAAGNKRGGLNSRETGVRDGEEDGSNPLAFQLMPAKVAQSLCQIVTDPLPEDCPPGMDNVQLFSTAVQQFLELQDDTEVDMLGGLLLDYFVSGLWWAVVDMRWKEPAKVSAMYTILYNMLLKLKGGPFLGAATARKERDLSIVDVEEEPAEQEFVCAALPECALELKKILVLIAGDAAAAATDGVNVPPGAFSIEEASHILNYMTVAIMQHYRLWEFIFTHRRAEEILGTSLHCNNAPAATVPFPAPLPDAVTEELYEKFMPTSKKKAHMSGTEKQGTGASLPATGGAAGDSADSAAEKEAAVAEQEKSLDALATAVSNGKMSMEELMSQLSPEEVERIVDEVCHEVLESVEKESAAKLRDSENVWIAKINKIHRVAPSE